MTDVLILAPKYPPDSGGASVYFQQVVELLEETDFHVTVFAPRHPERAYKTKESGAVIYRAFPPVGERFYTGLKEVDRFHWLLKRVNPEIAHVHPHFPQYRWFRWLLKYHRIPRVYDCRDKSFNRRYVSDGSYYLSVSVGVDRILAREVGVPRSKIARAPVIMPEIEPAQIELGDGYHIAFVGDVVEHKGIKLAVQAVEQLEGYDVTLHIAGDGELVDWLETRLWKPHIVYHGQVPHNRALGLIQAVDCIVIPSKCEASPRVAREALAVNTPAVATSAGDLPETLDKTGVIVNRTVESIAAGIENVLSNSAYSEEMEDEAVTQSLDELQASIVQAYSKAV